MIVAVRVMNMRDSMPEQSVSDISTMERVAKAHDDWTSVKWQECINRARSAYHNSDEDLSPRICTRPSQTMRFQALRIFKSRDDEREKRRREGKRKRKKNQQTLIIRNCRRATCTFPWTRQSTSSSCRGYVDTATIATSL